VSASHHQRRKRKKDPDHEAAKSFTEIGLALGCTRQAAEQAFYSGMKKLKSRLLGACAATVLADELTAARQARLRGQLAVSSALPR
jgi:hypothetical protein